MNTVILKTKLRSKRQVTLPVHVCEDLGISVGDPVTFVKAGDGVWVLTSKPIPTNQSVMEFLKTNLGDR